LRSIPPGLGELSGEDARARLRRWWRQAHGTESPAPAGDGRLGDLLAGLEWSEAILVANSFEHDVLLRLCPPDQDSADQADEP
jgi:hypothetical protein